MPFYCMLCGHPLITTRGTVRVRSRIKGRRVEGLAHRACAKAVGLLK